jgi:DNA repair exonuclease SbcCD ATPase subunit
MKEILIKSLSLTNFKGIKNLQLDFEEETDIFGANGTGKTTVADAFTWLLFGKDTSDRKDFEIKTLDANGKVIPMIDHEVYASLFVDNEPLTIKRVLKEKWVQKRGEEEKEFSGNVTELYWNEVPMSVTEFTKKVNDVLNEQVFKMITSPTYFNSIKWPERRSLLINVFGEVSNEDIAKGNSAYENLLSKLTQGKTLEDYKAQISASIKKAKEDLKNIPARIDEVFRGKPEDVNFEVLEKELESKNSELKKVDDLINNTNLSIESQLKEINDKKLKISNLKTEISIIEANAKTEASERLKPDTSKVDALQRNLTAKKQELATYESSLKTLSGKLNDLDQSKTSLEQKIIDARNDWNVENAKQITFNDNDFHCPTCKREFESGNVDAKKTELTNSFNQSKQKKLAEISAKGKSLTAEKINTENEITGISERIKNGKIVVDGLKTEIGTIEFSIKETEKPATENSELTPELLYESILSLNLDYKSKKSELEQLEANPVQDISIDNSELTEKKRIFQSEIDAIKTQLQNKVLIEAADKRISELKAEQSTLTQQIANVEKEHFVIENFIKAKVDALEQVVNSKFKYVKFKMFDEQINGGLKETCEATINGVPYSDANTASRINAGLDIINVLSEYYQMSAPIFIDNKESVINIIDLQSQIITLNVKKGCVLSVGKPIYTKEYLKEIGKTQLEMDEIFYSEHKELVA